MYCSGCGRFMESDAAFCAGCGVAVGGIPTVQKVNGGRVGYSSRIDDPAFDKYRKDVIKWTAVWAFGLPVLAVLGFLLYGAFGNEIGYPESLYYGLTIGGMFLLIGLFSVGSQKKKREDWDGRVVDKRAERKRKRVNVGTGDENVYRWEEYMLYRVIFEKDRGGTYELRSEDCSAQYEHYQIGDHVRYHGKLRTIEKYDKTKDSIIFCAACGFINDIERDGCGQCGCPLLK